MQRERDTENERETRRTSEGTKRERNRGRLNKK